MKALVFAYQSIGHKALSYLIEHRKSVAAVVTHKDHPGEKIWFASVADLARKHGLPVYYAEELDKDSLHKLAQQIRPDIILSFYYRNMIPVETLALAPRGGMNLHGSFLPKYRGRAPANWVLVNDEPSTGVTLHEMVRKADAGAIVAQKEIIIDPRETITSLYDKMVQKTGELMEETYPKIERGDFPRVPQDEREATVVGRRCPEDGRIDWAWTSRKIDCLVRAVTDPYPGAFTHVGGKPLVIWEGVPLPDRAHPPLSGALRAHPAGTVGLKNGKIVVSSGDGSYRVDRHTWDPSDRTDGRVGGDLKKLLQKGDLPCTS